MKLSLRNHLVWLGPLGLAAVLWSSRVGSAAASGPLPKVTEFVAPELVGNAWLPQGTKPVSLQQRRGKVSILFFDGANGSSLANRTAYGEWLSRFKEQGVQVIGVRSLGSEAAPPAAAQPAAESWPVTLLDNDAENWKRWKQPKLPTIFLIDAKGRVRYRWEGDLEFGGAGGTVKMARRIEDLLDENNPKSKVDKSSEEWRQDLTAEQFNVLRQQGTERPYSGEYWNNHETGEYLCAGCGQKLFDSSTKFESGTGWPSFWKPINGNAVTEKRDFNLGMVRTEVVCSRCGGHLGHVFDDGPKPTGLRYCMNSAALKFEKK